MMSTKKMRASCYPLLALCGLLVAASAQAEGFTAYFVQHVTNGKLTNDVSCEVLVSGKPLPEGEHVITKEDGIVNFDGKPVTSGVILGESFAVSAGWDPTKGCSNEAVPKSAPMPLKRMPVSVR